MGQGTGDRELGAGNWAGNWGQQTGDRELGTGKWDRELGTGNWRALGQGTGNWGEGSGTWGQGYVEPQVADQGLQVDLRHALRDLERQGWETLPIAILGTPNLPPAWAVDTWKPVGGCKFTGYFSGTVGNSVRFCLLLKWRAIRPQASDLFPAQVQGDSLSCCPAEGDTADLESVSTPSSNNSANRANQLTQAIERDSTKGSRAPHLSQTALSPQLLSPPLFVPWSQVASLRGFVGVHKDIEACPYEELKAAMDHPTCFIPGEKGLFLDANDELLCQLKDVVMPLENIAPQVFQRQQAEISWITLLWTVAQLNKYWIGYDAPPLPSVFQINCGGLGAGRSRVTSHHTFTAHVRQSEKVKSMGRRSPQQMLSRIRALPLPQDALRVCTRLPPFFRSRKTLARNGKPSGWVRQLCCTNAHNKC